MTGNPRPYETETITRLQGALEILSARRDAYLAHHNAAMKTLLEQIDKELVRQRPELPTKEQRAQLDQVAAWIAEDAPEGAAMFGDVAVLVRPA